MGGWRRSGPPPPPARPSRIHPQWPCPPQPDPPSSSTHPPFPRSPHRARRTSGQPHAPPSPPPTTPPPATPGPRPGAAGSAPAVASMVLLSQAPSTAYVVTNGGVFARPLFVIANWGEYGTAGLLAVQTSIAVALLGTAHFARILHKAD